MVRALLPKAMEYVRRNKLIIFIGAGALVFLLLLFLGVRMLVYGFSVLRERVTTNNYGVRLVAGPLSPGGPTFGPGDHADLDTLENGWEWYGDRDDPKTKRTIFISVRNKSKRTWHDVEAQVAVCDAQGNYLRTEPCPFGSLAPGVVEKRSFGPVGPEVGMFRLLGYKGR
jgi:hypothetical protein